MDYFILLEHEFIHGARTRVLSDVMNTYSTFTKTVVALFHGEHSMSDIHSALIVAEDHLTIILEDSQLDDSFLRFVERAIKFIKDISGESGNGRKNVS